MAAPRSPTFAWQRLAPALATFALFVLVVGCLFWARAVLIPVAVATLVTFILGPLVMLLQRRGLPRAAAVSIVVIAACTVLSAALWLVGSQVVQLLAELPEYQHNVAKRVAEVRERGSGTLLANVQRFVHEVSVAATGPPATPGQAADEQAVTVRVVERAAASNALLVAGAISAVTTYFSRSSGLLEPAIALSFCSVRLTRWRACGNGSRDAAIISPMSCRYIRQSAGRPTEASALVSHSPPVLAPLSALISASEWTCWKAL